MRHPIITIYDLKHLTDAELEVLDKALHYILNSRNLTEAERTNIIASLKILKVEIVRRQDNKFLTIVLNYMI